MPEFNLSKIEISGFRGFTVPQSISFGDPLTVIYGENRNGKSSIINAIEWCLFGSEVAAIKYGDIRERDAWEVKNLNSANCQVQCEFQSRDGKTLRVKRTYRSPKTTDLLYEMGPGNASADERKLHALLKISPSDFISSVHLHPEVIRSLIIAKPKDRKEAIDRLLGLSDLRDMVDALASENPTGWVTALDQELALLDARLTTALKEKQKIIDDESAELTSKGVKQQDLTADGARGYASQIRGKLEQFAKTYHLTAPTIPAPADFSGVQQFRSELPQAIQKLRSEHPILADQGKYRLRKSTLDGLKSSYAAQQKIAGDAKAALDSYPEKRSIEQLSQELSTVKADVEKIEAEMKDIAKNAAVLDNALAFFQNRAVSEQLSCPLCGETTRTVEEWRSHIQEEIKAKNLTPLQERKQALGNMKASLEKAKEEIAALQVKATDESRKLLERASEVGKAINRPILENDDPIAILNTEINAANEALLSLQGQVEAINSTLDSFQQALLDLDRFQRIGRAQQEMAKIEAIGENEPYKQLKGLRSECEQYAEDVELLIDGLKNAVRAEAGQRLTAVQESISKTFTKLTNRPDYPGLKVSTAGDGYAIELTKTASAIKAVPILNHADMNCAALSIFLALAGAAQISHQLGIVILDDPSQSLDSSCKKNICTVLTGLCDSRQIIVATADKEFRTELGGIHKNKTTYTVRGWTPTGGPILEVEAGSAAHAV
jgi:exonuclease SbcC